jgi:hypothetical protein
MQGVCAQMRAMYSVLLGNTRLWERWVEEKPWGGGCARWDRAVDARGREMADGVEA